MRRRVLRRIFLLGILVFLLQSCGSPTDLFVDPAGSDDNDCLTAETACATIEHVLSLSSPVHIVIHIAAGDYRLAAPLELHERHAVYFVGEDVTTTVLYSPPDGGPVINATTVMVSVENLSFDGRYTSMEAPDGSLGILLGENSSVNVEHSAFNGLSIGIERNQGDGLIVSDCWFTDNGIGIRNFNPVHTRTAVFESRFYGNTHAVESLADSRLYISGSTFVDNGLRPPEGLLPATIHNAGWMAVVSSTFTGDAFYAVKNDAEGDLRLTDVVISDGTGSGIRNDGQLQAANLTISGMAGGGFVNAHEPGSSSFADARLESVRILGNGGFGIRNDAFIDLIGSVVDGNEGDGLIANGGIVGVYNSAIIRNDGRGILQRGSMNIVNSTISGNHEQGMVMEAGLLEMSYATIAENDGGGFQSLASASGHVAVADSIIALNPGGVGNCLGHTDWVFLETNIACYASDSVIDPGLGPLTEVGGTWVHPLVMGSPAVDYATGDCPEDDQRGNGRPVGGGCDVGAYEYTYALQLDTSTPVVESGEETLPPTPTATPAPASATFVINANCRRGPAPEYAIVTSFSEGQTVGIEGINQAGTWYWVLVPGTNSHCWVWGNTVQPSGDLSILQIILPEPLPSATPVPGCWVYDQQQQAVCTVPCPANAQPGGACQP